MIKTFKLLSQFILVTLFTTSLFGQESELDTNYINFINPKIDISTRVENFAKSATIFKNPRNPGAIDSILLHHSPLNSTESATLMFLKASWEVRNYNKPEAYIIFKNTLEYIHTHKIDFKFWLTFYSDWAVNCNDLGQNVEAIDYYLKAISYCESLEDSASKYFDASRINYNIGNLYAEMKDFDSALQYYNKALDIAQKHDILRIKAASLTSMSSVYMNTDSLLKAESYSLKAIEISKEIEDEYQLNYTKNILAIIYQLQKRLEESEKLLKEVELKCQEWDDPYCLANANLDLGLLQKDLNHIIKAKNHCKESLRLYESISDSVGIKDATECLYQVSKQAGEYMLALEYFEKVIDLEKRIINEQNVAKITSLTKDYEFQKEKIKTELLHTQEVNQATKFRNYLLMGLLLLAGLLFFAYRAYRIKKKTAETISTQKDQIEKYSKTYENLIFSLSHDIKEPMLGLQVLLKKIKSDDDYLQRAADNIGDQVSSINGIVNNLLQLKKATVREENESTSKEEIIVTVDEVTKALNYKLSEKNINLIIRLENTLSDPLPISSKKLYLVILNLLSNAAKYSFEDGIIEVYAQDDGIFVRDYGSGIDAGVLSQIGNNKIEKPDETSGSGLGLLLISNILTSSKMKLLFEQADGGGTVAGIVQN